MRKKAVIIGGGNGSALTINALKKYSDRLILKAIISMSDSGGSSGILRQQFDTLPPGDIMRATLAMSKFEYGILKEIFYKSRFESAGKLNGHNLGNLFLVLSEHYDGNFINALNALHQAVQAVGKVYPVTLDQTDLVVELSNGDIVKGEEAIDRPCYDRGLKIKKARLEPVGEIYPDARKAIEQAEYIFIGPGSFYCSIVSTLLQRGVSEAIARSSAKLIYISGNAYEIEGETGPEKLSDFVKELHYYLPRKLNSVILNTHRLSNSEQERYTQRSWKQFEQDWKSIKDCRMIMRDYEKEESEGSGLSAPKLGKIIREYLDESENRI